MNVEALKILIDGISALNTFVSTLTQVSSMLAKAQAEERDLTEDEWAVLKSQDEEARKALQDALK